MRKPMIAKETRKFLEVGYMGQKELIEQLLAILEKATLQELQSLITYAKRFING